jgi:lipopolysaccharide export system protein LptA
MHNRIERLRVWLLGSAIFLVLVIVAFIGAARYVRHRLLKNLPAKLGVNVQSDASGWTASRSVGPITIYKVHAAKWERRTDGTMALHDVSILLYGKKGDRRDHVYGDEFSYDQNAGVLRATGVVHIDLQSAPPGAKPGEPVSPDAGEASDPKVLHVTTSGLVYLEKLGVAATTEYIEFQAGGMKGHATGADYSSDSGMLMLHSTVSMSGATAGRPVNLTAAEAQFDTRSQEAVLTDAKYESQGRTAAADQAKLHRRADGTLERVEAQGNVRADVNDGTVAAQRADVALTATSEPQSAVLTGGVKYAVDRPLRQVRAQSDAATIAFDGQVKPQPQHAVFTGVVHVTERTRATQAAKEPWSTRDLTAAKVDADLVHSPTGRADLRNAKATGSPHLTVVNNGTLASNAGAGTMELSADDLTANMLAASGGKAAPQVDTIAGRGHTVVRQVGADGKEQISTGDSLDAKFRPRGAPGTAKGHAAMGEMGPELLASSVQMGHVTVTRKPKAGSQASVERATSARAAYDGDQDRVTLTGGVQVTGTGSELWANQVVLDHATGDSHATGGVKVDYVQTNATRDGKVAPARTSGPIEATHILADRADMQRATDVATFYGKPVRLWQGGDQVMAPVIEFSRPLQRLIARGEAGTGWSGAAQAAQVHTVLMSTKSGAAGGVKAAAAKTAPAAGCENAATKGGASAAAESQESKTVRIASGGLIYSGILRQAEFTGGVRADTQDGTIRANGATVYRKAVPTHDGETAMNGAAGSVPVLAGDLDRVVAAGHVQLDKPGIRGSGERLVYTASDRVFLLTGDAANPPKAVDGQGTTTGAALRFQSSCGGVGGGRVEALGTVPGEAGQSVRTDVRISDDKKGKGK